jgi:hypothetical protein
MLINVKMPNKFQILIQNCGTDSLNGSYKKLENKNPIILGKQVVDIMANDFAGKEYSPLFSYYLACGILKGLDFERDKLFADIDSIQDKIKKLTLEDKDVAKS